MSATIDELAALPVVHRDPQGNEHHFARLTLIGWGEVQTALESRKKRTMRSMMTILKDIGLNMELMPAAIRQVQSEPTTRETLYFMQTPIGAVEVLKVGARNAGWELTDVMIGQLVDSPMDLLDLASEVANLPKRPVPGSAPGSEGDSEGGSTSGGGGSGGAGGEAAPETPLPDISTNPT